MEKKKQNKEKHITVKELIIKLLDMPQNRFVDFVILLKGGEVGIGGRSVVDRIRLSNQDEDWIQIFIKEP